MKTVYKIFSIVLAGTLSFFSCSEDDAQRELSPEVTPGCQGVFFPVADTVNASAYELEPTDPTEITLQIARTATDAATVPLVAELNEQGVFNVPESVSFASGEQTKDIKVTFPGAKEGVSYILKLRVEGDAYVNAYATTLPYVQTSVTRIKWEDMPEPGVMVEGLIAPLFGIPSFPFYVQMQKVTLSNATIYRLIRPFRLPTADDADADGIYDGYPYNRADEMIDGEYRMVITVDASGNVKMDPCELGMAWTSSDGTYYGMFSAGSIYGNLSSDLASYPLGTIEGDVITFPAGSLYIRMASLPNPYVAETRTTLYLTKQAYLDANSSITDYNGVEYETVAGAISAFASAAFEAEWDQELQKAIDQKPDDADSPYKNLYYLPGLYGEGYGLAFYFDGENVKIPANQPTGVTFLNNDIYVSQSEELSSAVVTTPATGLATYSFGLNFHTEDRTSLGAFSETFYYGKNDIKRTVDDFCGLFTMRATSGYDGSSIEYPVRIMKANDNKTLKIEGLLDPATAKGFGYSDDAVSAVYNASENCVILEPQALAESFVYQGEEYPLLFITYSSATDDIYDDQSIRIICRYNDVLQFASHRDNTVPIDGYTYYVPGLGVLDYIPYNITLTPSGPAPSSSVLKSAPSIRNIPLKKGAGKLSILSGAPVKKELSSDNFSIREKSKDRKRQLKPGF